MGDGRRYWAFLSYSHSDRAWARWLHRALETYPVPRRLVGRSTAAGIVPRRLRPIFRDREDLAADADLRGRVELALENSAFLIVICSPAAARSAWVDQEIVRFKRLHGESRVLAVIVAGSARASAIPGREGEECFPRALRVRLDAAGGPIDQRADPIAADLRSRGDGRRLARLKLLARMLEVDLDDLARRDAQRRQGQLVGLAGASTAVAVAMGVLAAAAVVARDEARGQRARAEGLVEFMLGDLRKKLEPEGRLEILDAVGSQAMEYYKSQARHGMDADALGRRARVLHLLGDIEDKRGDLGAAGSKFLAAAATTGELLRRDPDNPKRIYDHAQSVYWVGYIDDRRGHETAAEIQFGQYKNLADQLIARDPHNDDWLAEVGYAASDLGTLYLKEGRAASATPAFLRALRVSQVLAAKAPSDRDRRMDLAQSFAWLADAEVANGRTDVAMRDRLSERAIYLALLAERPTDDAAAKDLIVNEVAVAKIKSQAGDDGGAIEDLRIATDRGDRLLAAKPDHTEVRAEDAFAWIALARSLLKTRAFGAAATAATRARALAETLVRTDGTVAEWQVQLLGAGRLLQIEVAAERAANTALQSQALLPAGPEAARLMRLSDATPSDANVARVAAEAALLAGDHESLARRQDHAQAEWLAVIALLRRGGVGETYRTGDRNARILTEADRRLGRGAGSAGGATSGAGQWRNDRFEYAW